MNGTNVLRVQWLLLALLTPCAMAQTPEADRQREYYRQLDQQREEQQRRAQEEMQRQQKSAEDARKRDQESRDETSKNIEDYRKRQSQAAPGGQGSPGTGAQRPKLPAERNVLLGSWRVDSGGQGGGAATGPGQGKGTDRNAMARELMTTFSNPCVLMFGKGITFAPSTYSIQAVDGSVFQGSVNYSSPQERVILAITQESWKTLPFEIESPNRIVWGRFGCALVRVGAPATNAAANAKDTAGTARAGASGASAPRSSTAIQTAAASSVVVDGAAFRCANGSHFFVSLCQGPSAEAMCKLSDPTVRLDLGSMMSRTAIAAKVQGCEAGGIRYGADDKPIFVP